MVGDVGAALGWETTTEMGWPLATVSGFPVPLASRSGVTRSRLVTALGVPSLAGSSAFVASITITVLSQRPLARKRSLWARSTGEACTPAQQRVAECRRAGKAATPEGVVVGASFMRPALPLVEDLSSLDQDFGLANLGLPVPILRRDTVATALRRSPTLASCCRKFAPFPIPGTREAMTVRHFAAGAVVAAAADPRWRAPTTTSGARALATPARDGRCLPWREHVDEYNGGAGGFHEREIHQRCLRRTVQKMGVRPSMGTVGDAYHNALPRVFATSNAS